MHRGYWHNNRQITVFFFFSKFVFIVRILHRLAALEGHIEVVRSLLEYGADVNKKDADGRSTLYVLALENHLAMAKFFLEPGRADVESTDSEVCIVFV